MASNNSFVILHRQNEFRKGNFLQKGAKVAKRHYFSCRRHESYKLSPDAVVLSS